VRQLSAYFAALPPAEPATDKTKPKQRRVKRLAQVNHCASCHLRLRRAEPDAAPGWPARDYLLKAMKDYPGRQSPGFDEL